MYDITVSSVPAPQETDKDLNPGGVGVWGAEVAKGAIIGALLQHGRFDRLYVPCESSRAFADAKAKLEHYSNSQRAKPILLDGYRRLDDRHRMVLFHPGASGADGIRNPGLYGLLNLRSFVARPRWPVTGLTHSISGQPGFWFMFQALLAALRSHDALVCTSEAGRNAVEQLIPGPSQSLHLPVIPLGIDTTAYRPRDKNGARAQVGLPRHSTVFLYLGRFSTQYKADLFPLILAFSQLPLDKRSDAVLVIAGDDVQHGLSPSLESVARQLGIADRIRLFPNPTHEAKMTLYRAADVFVSPSDNVQETFGLTVIEAMAFGLPVIASDWSGYRDTVADGLTGFLIPTYWADCVDDLRRTPFLRPPLDLYGQLAQAVTVDIAALSRSMMRFVDDPALGLRMGAVGRRRAMERYDWSVVIGQYEGLWTEHLGRAEQLADEDPGQDLCFDYLNVFRNHPTAWISETSRVRLGAVGLALASGESRIDLFDHTELDGRGPSTMATVAACEPAERMPIGELIRRVCRQDAGGADVTFQSVAQLIKYGILDLC